MYHSTLGLRVMKKKKLKGCAGRSVREVPGRAPARGGWGFEAWGSGFRVQGLGFRAWGLGFRVQGLGFRVQGSEFRA